MFWEKLSAARVQRSGRRYVGNRVTRTAALIAAAVWLASCGEQPIATATGSAAGVLTAAPSLAPPAPLASLLQGEQWLNSRPLRAEDLRGKVVLVNFWTYSCINSLRTLPYLRAWAEKYGPHGLVVIGVHSPEFSFEHDLGRVREASAALKVTYPVVLDGDFATWREFGNDGWPAFYFIDANGKLRYRKLGEGDYAASEAVIRQLLAEAGAGPVNGPVGEVGGDGAQAAPDWDRLHSPETYLGHAKARNFVSPGGARPELLMTYRSAPTLALNQWSLDGRWVIERELAALGSSAGSINYHFQARDVHLVMGPGAGGRPARFRVTLDGVAPGPDHGADIDAQGWGTLREDRLYQLVRQIDPSRGRTVTIEFPDGGVRAYVFTFG